MIFIGGIGAILLAIGQSISSQNDKTEIISTTKEENKQLKNELADIKKERDVLNKELAIRDKKIHEQTDTIIELQKQQNADFKNKLDLENQSNFNQLKKAFSDLFRLAPFRARETFKHFTQAEQIEFIEKVKTSLESELRINI